ncbi:hypothetical protein HY624_01355, partial [Candidatus Uhrbacteria bacterium]|nr:hypothetical protein [Candidatus Uhrbacteria bacterium]
GQLLFSIINVYFPDALSYSGNEFGSLRFSLATIIVVLPFYFFITRFLVRIRRNENYQDVRIRKWLIYLTLSLAAIAIVSDLVTLLYWLLDGDLTARFLLKVVTVLIIAAAVFYYYFWELSARVAAIRLFVAATLLLICVFVVFGFFVIGSPTERRAQRFDEQRIQDLQNIQGMVVNYWQRKGSLPVSLANLADDISGFVSPSDPESGSSYDYRVQAPLSFELCTTFTTSATQSTSKPMMPYAQGVDHWNHGIGSTCFSRTIDPELYKELVAPGNRIDKRGNVTY